MRPALSRKFAQPRIARCFSGSATERGWRFHSRPSRNCQRQRKSRCAALSFHRCEIQSPYLASTWIFTSRDSFQTCSTAMPPGTSPGSGDRKRLLRSARRRERTGEKGGGPKKLLLRQRPADNPEDPASRALRPPDILYAMTRSAAAASVSAKKRFFVSLTLGAQGSICAGLTGKCVVGPAASA